MAWIKIENEIVFHPKILAAGNEAIGAWIRCIAWCNAELTDGRVPESTALEIARSKRVLKRLIDAQLLTRCGKHYEIHDYNEYQTRARAISERARAISAAKSRAGKLGAQKRWEKQQKKAQTAQPTVINRNDTVTAIRNEDAQIVCHGDGKITRPDGTAMAQCDGTMLPNVHGKKMAKSAQVTETTLATRSHFDVEAVTKLKERLKSRLSKIDTRFDFEAIETKVKVDSRKVRAHDEEDERIFIRNGDCNGEKPNKKLPYGKMAKNTRIHEKAKHACVLGGASRAAVELACEPDSTVSVHAAESARTDELSNTSHQADSTVAGGALPDAQSSELVTPGALRRADLDSACESGASPAACRREKPPALASETRLGTEAMHAPGPGAKNRSPANFDQIGRSTERTLGVAALEEMLVGHGLVAMSPRWATRAQAMSPFSPDEIRRAMITAWSESHAQRPSPGFIVAILERWRAEVSLPPKVPAPDSEWSRARAREAEQRKRERRQQSVPAEPVPPRPPPVEQQPDLEIDDAQRERNIKFLKQFMKNLSGNKSF